MKEFKIGSNEAGQRLDKYLHKLLPKAGSGFLYKMLRKKNIVLNGKKAEGSARLEAGSTVTLYLSNETFEKFSFDKTFSIELGMEQGKERDEEPLQVLYEDADILIINKPAGMLSQKSSAGDISANEKMIQYLLESGSITQQQLKTFRPSVCSRLDRNTSGVLIAGKTLNGLQTVSRQLKERTVQKYYICIVSGIVEKPQHLKDYIIKDHSKNKVRIIQNGQPCPPGGQYIETQYRPLRVFRDATVLEVRLITGRSHQIRAHLAAAGHPVIGDVKYGDSSMHKKLCAQAGIRHQLLHAGRIVLADGREASAPLPPEFQRLENLLTQLETRQN